MASFTRHHINIIPRGPGVPRAVPADLSRRFRMWVCLGLGGVISPGIKNTRLFGCGGERLTSSSALRVYTGKGATP